MIDIDDLVIKITVCLDARLVVRNGTDDLLRHARSALLELAADAQQAKEERDLAQRLLIENNKK